MGWGVLKFSFLERGVVRMFSSRLSGGGGLIFLDRVPDRYEEPQLQVKNDKSLMQS